MKTRYQRREERKQYFQGAFILIISFVLCASCLWIAKHGHEYANKKIHCFVTDKTYGDTIHGYPIVGIVRLDNGQIFYEYQVGDNIYTEDQTKIE